MTDRLTILEGDCRKILPTLPEASVHCCVTSPPYWGLRDYECCGQIGLESSVALYVKQIVEVFRGVHRVLWDDGTLWLNLGDSYAASPGGGQGKNGACVDRSASRLGVREQKFCKALGSGLAPKNLVGIPWRVAFALQEDGWILRSDIIWHKPNPMPESVTDRPTKSHEYIFLLSKSERYYYDAEAIKEPVTGDAHARARKERSNPETKSYPANGRNGIRLPGVTPKSAAPGQGIKANESFHAAVCDLVDERNKRSVWTVTTSPYREAHFATYPPDLIKPCVLAGCPAGGTVLDPFGGSGTTGMVALELGRKAILIELNQEYVRLAKDRCNVTPGFALTK